MGLHTNDGPVRALHGAIERGVAPLELLSHALLMYMLPALDHIMPLSISLHVARAPAEHC